MQTKPTAIKEESPLLAADVCAIIESCGKAGVRIFKYGSLYLSLGPSPERVSSEYPIVVPDPGVRTPNHAQQNVETLKRDEEELRAEQLRMLMIENPIEYERQLRDGELADEPEFADDGEA